MGDWLDRYKADIRNVLVGVVIAAAIGVVASLLGANSPLLVGLVVGLVGLAALELRDRRIQIRHRIPFRFQSPIIWAHPRSHVKKPPPELGSVDLEFFLKEASEASNRLMSRMTKEINRQSNRMTKETALVQRGGKAGRGQAPRPRA